MAGGLIVLSLLVLACVASPPSQSPVPAEPTQVQEPVAAATALPPQTALDSTATPSATDAERQTLRLPITEPPTLDPGLATDTVSVDLIIQIFEGLVGFDDRGNVFGLGAESWEISADGLTYTFRLRDGSQWSDGKPVTATDYSWAWKRSIDPRTASDYATTLYPIKNAVNIHRERLDPEQLGVEAHDERTLIVKLERPSAYFLRLASTWPMMPLRQDVVERFGDRWIEANNIVTNGPFLLKERRHDAQIVLERNEAYWGHKPELVRAVYRVFPNGDNEPVLTAYEAGELDTLGAGTSFEIPANQVDRVAADLVLKQEVKTFDQSATMFIAVNTRRPHLRDRRVRTALGQAIERDRLVNRVLKRVAKPAVGLQPEGIPGRDPGVWPQEDLEAARKNLADAGFPEGRGLPEMTFTYNNNPQWKLMGEYLQQRYKDALGVRLKLDPMEWAPFLSWRRGEDWQAKGDLYRGGWFSDYDDSNNWYNVLWDSREDAVVFNIGWKNDDYDRLVRAAQAELDRERRRQLYQEAEEILAREYPAIPVFHYALRTLVKPYVENFEPERVLGLTRLQKVKLAGRP